MQITVRAWGLMVLLFAARAYGQPGTYSMMAPQTQGGILTQPARLAQPGGFKHVLVGGIAGLWAGNDAFTMKGILDGNNRINAATKDRILRAIDRPSVLQAGVQGEAFLAFTVKKRPFSLTYQYFSPFIFEAADTATVGLILKGNAPYAGQVLEDHDFSWQDFTYHKIGVGSAWQWGEAQIGLRFSLVLGESYRGIKNLDYTLFTSDTGDQIDLNATYEAFQSLGSSQGGTGMGLDAGLTWPLNRSWTLELALNDWGWIKWKGLSLGESVDVRYEGVVWNNFIRGPANNNVSLGDTLQSLLFPDSTAQEFSMWMPGSIRLGSQYRIGANQHLMLVLAYAPTAQALHTPLPMAFVGYRHTLSEYIDTGLNLYAGGIDQYGIGVLIGGRFPMDYGKQTLGLFIRSENILGMIAPGAAKGFGIQGGISWSY